MSSMQNGEEIVEPFAFLLILIMLVISLSLGGYLALTTLYTITMLVWALGCAHVIAGNPLLYWEHLRYLPLLASGIALMVLVGLLRKR